MTGHGNRTLPTRSVPRLDALERGVDAAEKALAAGATDLADRLLGRMIDALEQELVARGVRTREPALFDDLLLAAQQAREAVPIDKEKARVDH